jgi:hypothetical protein
MRARWASFVVGMWLILAPLVIGYDQVAAILHDVALGLVVCVLALAAMNRSALRFALAAPGIWLMCAVRLLGPGGAASKTDLAAGAALVFLAPLAGGRMAHEKRPARMAV